MMLPLTYRRISLILTLTALPLLVGSSCVFFFSSGDGSSDKKDRDKDSDRIIVVSSGVFGDPAVAGVNYESGSLLGVTGENGEFQYEPDKTVRFFLGDISLGPEVMAKPVITAKDLALKDASGTSTYVNILRLLWSLDSQPDNEVITIPGEVRVAAVKSNEDVSSAIEFLDFTDDTAFVNAASHLIAVLANGYPMTTQLISADEVQKQRLRSIEK